MSLYQQRRYDEALRVAKQVLSTLEQKHGRDHQSIAEPLNNLAAICLAQGSKDFAVVFFERARLIIEKYSGRESVRVARALENLAMAHFGAGNRDASEKLFLEAIKIREKTGKTETIEASQALEGLGALYEVSERFSEAARVYLESLRIRERLFGPTDRRLTNLLHKSACVLEQNRRVDEAMKYRARAEQFVTTETVRQTSLQGMAVHVAKPLNPPGSFLLKPQITRGKVLVEVLVNECGRVVESRAVSGPSELHSVSIGAAQQWRFTPTVVQGERRKALGTIEFVFK